MRVADLGRIPSSEYGPVWRQDDGQAFAAGQGSQVRVKLVNRDTV